MDAGTQERLPGSDTGRGRKGRDGIEETVKTTTLKKALPKLLKLYRKGQDAMTDYKDAVKAASEANGANAGDVNKLIKASFKGNFEDVRRHIEQQAIIFEIGEVSDSGE